MQEFRQFYFNSSGTQKLNMPQVPLQTTNISASNKNKYKYRDFKLCTFTVRAPEVFKLVDVIGIMLKKRH